MPEAFFGSPASGSRSAGAGGSDFELCVLPKWEDRFYKVLLVEIRHLIRLTGILLHQESTVGKEGGVSPEVMSGGYCGGVPPLPIPNREVKPACADGTAMQCGRVGGRLFSIRKPRARHPHSELVRLGGYEVDAYNAILSELWFLQAA